MGGREFLGLVSMVMGVGEAEFQGWLLGQGRLRVRCRAPITVLAVHTPPRSSPRQAVARVECARCSLLACWELLPAHTETTRAALPASPCLPACLQIVFSEAWWVGKAEDNPQEKRLPMPPSLTDKRHEKFEFSARAAGGTAGLCAVLWVRSSPSGGWGWAWAGCKCCEQSAQAANYVLELFLAATKLLSRLLLTMPLPAPSCQSNLA